MSKEVILTGLRSNSEFHLGNYLGAILPMVQLQQAKAGKYQMNMFIPDLHSFTTPIDHTKLYQQSIDNVKMFIAGGLDVNQPDTFVYRQSYIPAHSEMTWILNCFAYFGELSRMNEFKDKSTGQENITAGLFDYPVLMAADILLYGAKWVPVGDDQRQHLEFTRDLATRVNNKFGGLFVVPEDTKKQMEFSARTEPIRIRSLRNPDKKMSKSVEDPAGTILLSDTPDEAVKKVMGATTDDLASINFDFEKQPGVSNLLQILALLDNKQQRDINDQWQGKTSYGELKTAVGEVIHGFLANFQSKLSTVTDEQVISKLEDSEKIMSAIANETLHKVQIAVGLRR